MTKIVLPVQSVKRLDSAVADTLKFFSESRDLSVNDVAGHFGISVGVAQFHLNALVSKRFIRMTRVGVYTDEGESPPMFAITADGAEYVMQHH